MRNKNESKKWSFSRPTLFLLCLLVCLSCTAYAQEGTLPIISKEQAESNAIAEPATISFDKAKIEDLLTQYPATLENKGIVERDLTRIGVPSSVASQILNSKFNREVINAYLSSIGSSKTAPLPQQTRATGKCSCGYTMSTNITVDGSSGQVFHSSISCSSASINSYPMSTT